MAKSDEIYERLRREPGLVVRDVRHMMPSARPYLKRWDPLSQKRLIVVHYDAQVRPARPYDAVKRYQGQANFHINKVWGYDAEGDPIYGFGLMYHLNIAWDGAVYITQPLELRTWHATDANSYGLAVKLDCGAEQSATADQLASLNRVLVFMTTKCPEFPAARKDVWGHKELTTAKLRELGIRGRGNSTACPGRILPFVQRFRAGTW